MCTCSDTFVVELGIHEMSYHQVYTIKETSNDKSEERLVEIDLLFFGNVSFFYRCYYRFSALNEQLSFNDIRQVVIQQEVTKYEAEINLSEQNICKLKSAISQQS